MGLVVDGDATNEGGEVCVESIEERAWSAWCFSVSLLSRVVVTRSKNGGKMVGLQGCDVVEFSRKQCFSDAASHLGVSYSLRSDKNK